MLGLNPPNIIAQVSRYEWRVCKELCKILAGRVVEGEARDSPELRLKVL
jgi:hypothetical protein